MTNIEQTCLLARLKLPDDEGPEQTCLLARLYSSNDSKKKFEMHLKKAGDQNNNEYY
jgi:hypothetical protein